MIDLEDLARHDSQGLEISVRGVRVGDPTAKLSELTFDSLEPSFRGQMRYAGGVPHWTAEGSTTEVALTEAVLSDMLLLQGMHGRLRTHECLFEVAGGKVQHIFLFASLLAPLALDSVRSMQEVFGSAEGVDHEFGATLHYPSRDIRVRFNPDLPPNHRVSVVLGEDPWKAPVFDAQALLEAYLDIAHLLPKNSARMEFHGSRATEVRYERLHALLRVFGIGDHRAMTRGMWLRSEDPNHHKGLDALWAATKLERPEQPRLNAYDHAFAELLRYRVGVERLFRHNRGWLECGDGPIRAMIAFTEAMSERIKAEVAPIDAVLCAFLDPRERGFGLPELVRHGYPDVDLRRLDQEEL